MQGNNNNSKNNSWEELYSLFISLAVIGPQGGNEEMGAWEKQ